jgi:hypothetical protein
MAFSSSGLGLLLDSFTQVTPLDSGSQSYASNIWRYHSTDSGTDLSTGAGAYFKGVGAPIGLTNSPGPFGGTGVLGLRPPDVILCNPTTGANNPAPTWHTVVASTCNTSSLNSSYSRAAWDLTVTGPG